MTNLNKARADSLHPMYGDGERCFVAAGPTTDDFHQPWRGVAEVLNCIEDAQALSDDPRLTGRLKQFADLASFVRSVAPSGEEGREQFEEEVNAFEGEVSPLITTFVLAAGKGKWSFSMGSPIYR